MVSIFSEGRFCASSHGGIPLGAPCPMFSCCDKEPHCHVFQSDRTLREVVLGPDNEAS